MRGLMNAPRKETAEEQLLHLIEGVKNPSPQIAGAALMNSVSPSPMKSSFRDRLTQAGQQFIVTAKFRLNGFFRPRQRGDSVLQQLQLASRVLWLVLLGLGVYLIAQVIGNYTHRQALVVPAAGGKAVGSVTPPPSPDTLIKPMAEYLSAILQRNPFTGASGATSAAPIQRARDRLKELTGSLVVVGIDRGARPEALIEDKNQGRTYFVKVGDVVNGAFVKEISVRGVIVEYEGEEKLLQ